MEDELSESQRTLEGWFRHEFGVELEAKPADGDGWTAITVELEYAEPTIYWKDYPRRFRIEDGDVVVQAYKTADAVRNYLNARVKLAEKKYLEEKDRLKKYTDRKEARRSYNSKRINWLGK
jgi:hypothetical protein